MPIIKNSSVQILFGNGDIGVRIGCNKERNSGAIQFTKIDPVPIGTIVETSDMFNLDVAPVTLGFNKVESLDVVINQLLKLRGVMSGEVEYERTPNGRIVEKNKS